MTTSRRSFLRTALATAAALVMPWRRVKAKPFNPHWDLGPPSKPFAPDQLPALSQWMRPVNGVMTLSHYDRDGVEVLRQTFPTVAAWYDGSNS